MSGVRLRVFDFYVDFKASVQETSSLREFELWQKSSPGPRMSMLELWLQRFFVSVIPLSYFGVFRQGGEFIS